MESSPAPEMLSIDLESRISACLARCDAYEQIDPAVWIHRLSGDELRPHARRVAAKSLAQQPLAGWTLAIKDNIDLAGVPTTAACPSYAYIPTTSAPVVERLLTAGAIPIGKTNLDQFATGLVGTRSPYGAPRNVFNADYISGGSSSGSAIAVAAGLVDVALGTDTAGSGRVPAALNGIIGFKPTRGRLSTRGTVPACRSLDCVSLFTRTVGDAAHLLSICDGYDALDPFSRPVPAVVPLDLPQRIGIPRTADLEWDGHGQSRALFTAAIDRLRALGCDVVDIDFTLFLATARLLYEGPWPAERYAAVGDFIDRQGDDPALDPTVAAIIRSGGRLRASEVFVGLHRLAELQRAADEVFATVDVLMVPTITTIATVAEVQADPLTVNARFGQTNNFMNLLDLCGLTVPAGRHSEGPGFGVTFIGPAWADHRLLAVGGLFHGEQSP